MAHDSLKDPEAFAAEVCWHYYMNEMTQAEIARLLGVTRLRVNQAIQRARQTGMVRIEIESPHLPRLESQDALRQRYGLAQALVVPSHPDRYDFHLPVGIALAGLISDRLRAGAWQRIGVSWGLTLQAAIDRMPAHDRPEVEVISMIGGTSHGESFNAFGIASGFAARLGASYSLLAAPIFLASQIDRDIFLAQSGFHSHFEKFQKLDAAILTCSDISPRSYLVRSGLPDGFDPAALTGAGAIGDVVCRFLDARGGLVSSALDAQTIGIDLSTLSRVPERVLAAAGPHKVRIMRVLLETGLANALVTDDVTADLLLQDDPPAP